MRGQSKRPVESEQLRIRSCEPGRGASRFSQPASRPATEDRNGRYPRLPGRALARPTDDDNRRNHDGSGDDNDDDDHHTSVYPYHSIVTTDARKSNRIGIAILESSREYTVALQPAPSHLPIVITTSVRTTRHDAHATSTQRSSSLFLSSSDRREIDFAVLICSARYRQVTLSVPETESGRDAIPSWFFE